MAGAGDAGGAPGAGVGEWKPVVSRGRGLCSDVVNECFAAAAGEPAVSAGGGGAECGGLEGSGRRSGGSFAERRAARCGFSAPRINTARFRSVSPLASPGVWSPYITIPPGLSPTTLLDSPVMLPSDQGQTSPTTGTFPFPAFDQGGCMPVEFGSNKEKDKVEEIDDSMFVFKPHTDFISSQIYPSRQKQVFPTSAIASNCTVDDANNQALVQVQPALAVDGSIRLIEEGSSCNFNIEMSSLESCDTFNASTKRMRPSTYAPVFTDQTISQNVDSMNAVEDTSSQQNGEEDQKEGVCSMGFGRPSEDGYSWRKYGQKQVKGSEYPRSYYKCTHQNCPVKKKVERSHDGQITEIIYKGTHNHPKPQINRRPSTGSVFAVGMSDFAREENGSVWKGLRQENSDHKSSLEYKVDGMERTSSASALTEVSEALSSAHGKHLGLVESADTPELSSTRASNDDDEDEATHGNPSHGDDGDGDESELKRRKREGCFLDADLAARAVREPRVVVQTDSEVDILDDGYRWRKYGQKVVKGNPNPRSYYKCTSAGCSVRKHVERASHDLKFVITTYEGKHNHEVPAARNSGHLNSTNGTGQSSSSHSFKAMPGLANIPKPEQAQDFTPNFEKKPELIGDLLKHGCLSSFPGDRNFGSMYYDMKLPPPLHPSLPLGCFGSNRAFHPAALSRALADLPLPSSSMDIHPPASLPLPGFDYNLRKPMDAYQPLLLQHSGDVDFRFLTPKLEKDDGAYESNLPPGHAGNASYPQMMGRFPS